MMIIDDDLCLGFREEPGVYNGRRIAVLFARVIFEHLQDYILTVDRSSSENVLTTSRADADPHAKPATVTHGSDNDVAIGTNATGDNGCRIFLPRRVTAEREVDDVHAILGG